MKFKIAIITILLSILIINSYTSYTILKEERKQTEYQKITLQITSRLAKAEGAKDEASKSIYKEQAANMAEYAMQKGIID